MSAGRFFARFVLAILLIALLVGGGYALYRAGVSDGYAQGMAVRIANAAPGDQGSTSPAVPAFPYYPALPYGYVYPFFPFFHPFWGIFGIFILFLVIFAITRLIFFRGYWRRAGWAGGPSGKEGGYEGPWMHHGPWSHGSQSSPEGQKPEEGKPPVEAPDK